VVGGFRKAVGELVDRVLENPRVMGFVDRTFYAIGALVKHWALVSTLVALGLSVGYVVGMASALPRQYSILVMKGFLFGVFYTIAVYVLVFLLVERREMKRSRR